MGRNYYQRMLVVGSTQCGKTFYLRDFVNGLNRYVIYDPDCQFGYSIDNPTSYDALVNNIPSFKRAYVNRLNRIVFQPRESMIMDDDKRIAEFDTLTAYVNQMRYLTFVIDEISSVTLRGNSKVGYCPKHLKATIKRKMKEPVGDRGGRIGIIATTQRLKDADVDFITQINELIVFNMLPRDVKYVEENTGFEISEHLSKLPMDWYLYYNRFTKEVRKGHVQTLCKKCYRAYLVLKHYTFKGQKRGSYICPRCGYKKRRYPPGE